MPSRVLREGIITSEAVNSLAWAEEVFYRRLHSVVDDFGRFSANHSLLRAAMYPLRLDDVSDQDVGKWLAVCADKGLVRVYEVGGKRYLEVTKFEQRRRADKSKYPPADSSQSNDRQLTDKGQASAHVGEGGIEGEGVGKAHAPSASPSTPPSLNGEDVIERIPLNDGTEFEVEKRFAEELDRLYPNVDVPQTLREIRGWCIGNLRKRKTRSGVVRFITSWFTREQNKPAPRRH